MRKLTLKDIEVCQWITLRRRKGPTPHSFRFDKRLLPLYIWFLSSLCQSQCWNWENNNEHISKSIKGIYIYFFFNLSFDIISQKYGSCFGSHGKELLWTNSEMLLLVLHKSVDFSFWYRKNQKQAQKGGP